MAFTPGSEGMLETGVSFSRCSRMHSRVCAQHTEAYLPPAQSADGHFTSHDAAQRHAESRAKTPEAESATSILIAPLPFFNVINDFSLCRFYINVKEKAGKTGWHVEKEKLGYFA